MHQYHSGRGIIDSGVEGGTYDFHPILLLQPDLKALIDLFSERTIRPLEDADHCDFAKAITEGPPPLIRERDVLGAHYMYPSMCVIGCLDGNG